MQKVQVGSLHQEDPLEEEMASHLSILTWESHGQRSLVGYSLWDHRESDRTMHARRVFSSQYRPLTGVKGVTIKTATMWLIKWPQSVTAH